MKKTIKIFISSPGDVIAERNKAMQIIKRLNRHFGSDVNIEGVFWERQALRATEDYQSNIVKPSSTDIVAVILWTRLGSDLASKYVGAYTNKQPITGTEWEFEDAYAQAVTNNKKPHLALYRKENDKIVIDPNKIDEMQHQKKLIKAFDDYWAKDDAGAYAMASHSFERTEEFEVMFERHLKILIEEILNQKLTFKANWLDGSPFRGLQSFEAEHSAVFFGREKEKNESREKLEQQIAKGKAFVLVTGSSGSGKSSLVKAGLLPDLQIEGMVNNVAFTRVVTFTPSDDEPTKALIGSIVKALPELKELQYSEENLEEHLNNAFAIKQALDSIAKKEKLTEIAQAKLIIYIDQFEELFTTPSIDEPMQEKFVELLFKLFTSSHVWVVASMRSDFMSYLDRFPKLIEVLNNGAEYKLGFPKQTEIGQIISKPAKEAGLNFEVDKNGKGLDDFLQESASKNQASLPLLEYLLEQLWERRDKEKAQLTFEAYKKLDGLNGAIGKKAGQVYDKLEPKEQKAMKKLIIMLATMGEQNNKITAKRVSKEQIERNVNTKKCAKVLLHEDVRLLISAKDDKGNEYYRVAHEALFTHWELAKETILVHKKDILLRDQLEKSSKRWREAKKEDQKSLLLQDGLPLNEALDLLVRREDELEEDVVMFVKSSEKKAKKAKNVRNVFGGTVIVIAVVVSVFMYGLMEKAEKEKQEVERVTGKLVQIVTEYGDEGIESFIKGSNRSVKIFESIMNNFRDSKNSEIRKILAISYYVMGIAYRNKKEYEKAIETFKKAIEINSRDDGSYTEIGNIHMDRKEYDEAIDSYEKAIEINPKNNVSRTHLGLSYDKKKEWDKAITIYKEAINAQPNNSIAYNNIGNIYNDKEEYDKAIEAYREAIEINPKDSGAYYNMGNTYCNKKEYEKAIEAYKRAIEINPKNDWAYHNIAILYNMYLGNLPDARIYYQKILKLNLQNDSTFINLYELQLITNQEINQFFEETYIKAYQDKKEEFIAYEMLKIIKNIAQNKKYDLLGWSSKYKGTYLDWGFSELDEWAKNIEDEKLKKKINDALDVFKAHNPKE